MGFLNGFLLGMVEGLTEFLPISSTAHLIIVSKLIKISQTDFHKFFEVFIQSGAILAVIFLYFNHLLNDKKLIKNLIFSFLPTALVGFLLYKIIKSVFFESYYLTTGALVFFGGLFLLVEYFISSQKIILKKSLKEISFKQAILIGLAQALAIIPGVSRSGVVIVTMMVMGYRRDQSAIYSFLLAVPTIFAASLLDIYKMKDIIFFLPQKELFYLLIGWFTAFISAYFSMRWLILFLQKKSLVVFGWYRLLIGTILLKMGK